MVGRISGQGGPNLNALIVALIVLLTVVLVLATGIGLSYLAASSILRAFGHRPQKQQQPVLTAVEAGTSGD